MSLPRPNALTLEANGGVLHVWLNRPAVRNAMSLEMVHELLEAAAYAEAGDTRVIVLRGAGGHFSAGADLKDMAQARAAPVENGRDPVAATNALFGQLCAAYAATPLAVVAVVEGAVMGGGFGLACTADVTIASASVDFRLPETSLGVVPAQIAPFLVERVGYAQAKRLSVTGARLDAAEAFRIGLVHEVCESGAALEVAIAATVKRILACAPGAIAATKELLRRARFEDPSSLIKHAAGVFAKAARSAEGGEGISAFVEKRKPFWAQARS